MLQWLTEEDVTVINALLQWLQGVIIGRLDQFIERNRNHFLMLATLLRQTKYVKIWLRNGADINAKRDDGK